MEVLAPARLSARLVAGLLDLFAQGALGLLLFVLALRFGGVAMPVVTVLVVVLGYSAVPLWMFGATPAMRLFGLRLVGLQDRPLELMGAGQVEAQTGRRLASGKPRARQPCASA